MSSNSRISRADLGLVGKTAIDSANQRLKEAGCKVRIRLNGKVLGIRATLPNKTGHGRKQQDIRLGIAASKEGLKAVEKRAHELDRQLILGTFRWGDWDRNPAPKPEEMPVSQLIESFKVGGKLRCSEATWDSHWIAVYKKLPQDEPLSKVNVLAVVNSIDPDSRSREIAVHKLKALCQFAGLDIDLSDYLGEYEPKPRDIPPDGLIVEWRERIPNPAWQWVYGVIATFGARPHEAFFCELIDEVTLQIHRGKTGPRISHAIRPEWVHQWDLRADT